jgi:hypothetical protein
VIIIPLEVFGPRIDARVEKWNVDSTLGVEGLDAIRLAKIAARTGPAEIL